MEKVKRKFIFPKNFYLIPFEDTPGLTVFENAIFGTLYTIKGEGNTYFTINHVITVTGGFQTLHRYKVGGALYSQTLEAVNKLAKYFNFEAVEETTAKGNKQTVYYFN